MKSRERVKLTWHKVLTLLDAHKNNAFELDATVNLQELCTLLEEENAERSEEDRELKEANLGSGPECISSEQVTPGVNCTSMDVSTAGPGVTTAIIPGVNVNDTRADTNEDLEDEEVHVLLLGLTDLEGNMRSKTHSRATSRASSVMDFDLAEGAGMPEDLEDNPQEHSEHGNTKPCNEIEPPGSFSDSEEGADSRP
ncbi:hypothetical protein PQX77_016959 [Marasmius sp. AFHP31]|nr:hypothetical protein PQX77_016959 [Marasmius sp. AFHP31]